MKYTVQRWKPNIPKVQTPAEIDIFAAKPIVEKLLALLCFRCRKKEVYKGLQITEMELSVKVNAWF